MVSVADLVLIHPPTVCICCNRTQRGAEIYAKIQGFINTVKKHAKNVFQELLKVNTNQAICWKTT